jgi:DNA-directed RNA polymerase specialized sigma24 family protein
MNEFEGLSFKEISEIKQLPVNTLISRKRYAVLFLRKYLKTIYEELKNNV